MGARLAADAQSNENFAHEPPDRETAYELLPVSCFPLHEGDVCNDRAECGTQALSSGSG